MKNLTKIILVVAPRLPAGAVAWVLDDPRQVPYLMVQNVW
jgi:hypothetical protein